MPTVRQFICWFASIDWTPEAVTAAGTTVLAFLTLVLAVGTLFLWRATRRLVKGAEETAARQLRAYLAIEKAQAYGDHPTSPQFPLPFTPMFSLRFKNCGQTPAYTGTYWIDVKVSQVPFYPDLNPTGKNTTGRKFELPPAMCVYHAQLNGDKIASISTYEQAREFIEEKIAFYVFGGLNFTDAFGKDRWLKFRLKYTADCMANRALDVEEITSN